MTVKGASSVVDRDWLSWDELAKENAAVLISVKRIEAPKDYGNGEVEAVRARIIVLTGKQAGEVFPNERILKAGVRQKLTEAGADVVGRVGFYDAGKRRNLVGLEDEAEGDIELAEKALKKHGAVSTSSNGSAPEAGDGGDGDEPPF